MRTTLLAASLSVLSVSAPDAVAATHEDPRLGYRIKLPKGWSPVPVSTAEQNIIAKFESKESYRPATARAFFELYRCHLFIVHFPPGSEFKDYHEYLEVRQWDGFHLVDVERPEDPADGEPAEKWEFKVEHHDVPRRLIVWTFRRGGEWFAAEFEVLEEHYGKLKFRCRKSLRTFELFDPDPAADQGVEEEASARDYDLDKYEDRVAWRALTQEQRDDWRRRQEEEQLRISREATPRKHPSAGKKWVMRETPHFLVISEMSPKLTEYYIDLFEAGREWMEEHFGELGTDYVRKQVVRLLDEEATKRVFDGNQSGFGHEQVLYRDLKSGSQTVESCDFVVDHFIREKLGGVGPVDEILSNADPFFHWLDEGLDAVRYADLRGSKFVLYTFDDYLREARRDDDILTARRLMEMTSAEYESRGWGIQRRYESQAMALLIALSRFDGGKSSLSGFLCRYLRRAVELLEMYEEESGKKRVDTGPTEATDERSRELKRLAEVQEREHRQRLLTAQLHSELCDWPKKTWSKVESAYKRRLR